MLFPTANHYQTICAAVTFSKILCFELLDASEVGILLFERHLILDIQTTSRLKKSYCKNVRWKCIKSEKHKSKFGRKEQKAMLPVLSWLNEFFVFTPLFFACPIRRARTKSNAMKLFRPVRSNEREKGKVRLQISHCYRYCWASFRAQYLIAPCSVFI